VKKTTLGLLAAAAALALMAALWPFVMTPRLVKFPLGLDEHLTYTGSLVTFMDPQSGLPLAKPATAPLDVQRHTYASGGDSSVALVHDDVVATTPGGVTIVQRSLYVMDRRTMVNVDDPRAYGLAPANHVNRAGTYFISLPMNLGADFQLPRWKETVGGPMLVNSSGTGTVNQLKVRTADASLPMRPVSAFEAKMLTQAGLPAALSPAQATARLQAAGVDIAAVAAALAPQLSGAELASLSSALTSPVPLRYYAYTAGSVAIEPRTGTIVKASGIVDGVAARPDTTALAPALVVLRAHTDVTGVNQLVSALESMSSAAPQPVMELRYSEAPDSVVATVSEAKSFIWKANLASRYLPAAALILSVLLLLGATFTYRRRTPPAATVVSVPGAPEVPRAAA
jgi:hypothetical protein